MAITNTQLINYARGQLGRPYWYGTFGQIASVNLYREKLQAYPAQIGKWPRDTYLSQLGQKVHDCAGLIKGAIFCNGNPDASPKYNCNFDYSANDIINKICTETGAFEDVPNIPGLVLWKPGHVGILLRKEGDTVTWLEAKGHMYGVIEASFGQNWEKWGKLPASWVVYEDQPAPQPDPKGDYCKVETLVLRKGDKCESVARLQILLNGLGYTDPDGKKLKVDKSFGPKVDYAVKAFQKDNYPDCGEADGVCGTLTWGKLING